MANERTWHGTVARESGATGIVCERLHFAEFAARMHAFRSHCDLCVLTQYDRTRVRYEL